MYTYKQLCMPFCRFTVLSKVNWTTIGCKFKLYNEIESFNCSCLSGGARVHPYWWQQTGLCCRHLVRCWKSIHFNHRFEKNLTYKITIKLCSQPNLIPAMLVTYGNFEYGVQSSGNMFTLFFILFISQTFTVASVARFGDGMGQVKIIQPPNFI